MSDAQESPAPVPQSGDIQIKYVHPDDHQPVFANHFVVHQNSFGEFRLSFFDLREPIVIGSTEERQKKFREIGHIDAVCVAEVVITKPRMAQVLAAILQNITKTPGKPVEATPEATESPQDG